MRFECVAAIIDLTDSSWTPKSNEPAWSYRPWDFHSGSNLLPDGNVGIVLSLQDEGFRTWQRDVQYSNDDQDD